MTLSEEGIESIRGLRHQRKLVAFWVRAGKEKEITERWEKDKEALK